MQQLNLTPVSNGTFREIINNYVAKGNALGETIKHYQTLIRDHNFNFNGIFLPKFNGFLGFSSNGIYMPVGGLKATVELCEQEKPFAKGFKIFIFKLDGRVTYITA